MTHTYRAQAIAETVAAIITENGPITEQADVMALVDRAIETGITPYYLSRAEINDVADVLHAARVWTAEGLAHEIIGAIVDAWHHNEGAELSATEGWEAWRDGMVEGVWEVALDDNRVHGWDMWPDVMAIIVAAIPGPDTLRGTMIASELTEGSWVAYDVEADSRGAIVGASCAVVSPAVPRGLGRVGYVEHGNDGMTYLYEVDGPHGLIDLCVLSGDIIIAALPN